MHTQHSSASFNDRETEFDRYYQGLLMAYTRFAALKDELRTAIEGPGYKRKR